MSTGTRRGKTTEALELAHIPPQDKLPDNRDYTNRFRIVSGSSGHLYTIAQHKTKRHWTCNCPGWLTHRSCRHLEAMGLPAHERPFEIKS